MSKTQIVLVGAPGARKTEVAEEFAALVEEELGPFHILDNLAVDLQDQLDRPVGIYGTYLENALIASRRLDAEGYLKAAGIPFIAVGSVIETMAHSAQNVEILSTGLVTADTQTLIMRESVTTTMLSFMFLDTFRYTYGFYIPLGEKLEVVGKVEDDNYRFNIDRNIGTILENFGLDLEPLRGSVEEMAKQMLASIKRIEALRAESVAAIEDAGVEEATAELAESPLVETASE